MLAVEVPLVRASVALASAAVSPPPADLAECVAARDALAALKERVPVVQRRPGGERRWNAVVNAPGPMDARNRGVPTISRAYHKMHEICLSCALIPTARSAHLCEAPGGFVQCVARHLLAGGDDAARLADVYADARAEGIRWVELAHGVKVRELTTTPALLSSYEESCSLPRARREGTPRAADHDT